MIDKEAATKKMEMTRQLLSEVVEPDMLARAYLWHHSDRVGWVVRLPIEIPLHITWKAGSLATLAISGPEQLRVCLSCYLRECNVPWNNCPRYPVGALLAGAVTGCRSTVEPTNTNH